MLCVCLLCNSGACIPYTYIFSSLHEPRSRHDAALLSRMPSVCQRTRQGCKSWTSRSVIIFNASLLQTSYLKLTWSQAIAILVLSDDSSALLKLLRPQACRKASCSTTESARAVPAVLHFTSSKLQSRQHSQYLLVSSKCRVPQSSHLLLCQTSMQLQAIAFCMLQALISEPEGPSSVMDVLHESRICRLACCSVALLS